MIRYCVQQRFKGTVIVFMLLILGAIMGISSAQDGSPGLIQTAEYDIGTGCPVAITLDPTGESLYLLMNNCGQTGYYLLALNVAEGYRLPVDDYADGLAVLNGTYIDLFINPLAFTPEGDLSIRYNDFETYASINVIIPLASGGEVTVSSSESYDALLAEYSDYPEFSVYSPDHTRVAVNATSSVHVIDVASEAEIVSIPLDDGDYALVGFSPDGTALQVVYPNNPDDMSDISATLSLYGLPDGELIGRYTVPSTAVWVSPDGTQAALQLYSSDIGERSELAIIDLESGLVSAASNLLDQPGPVTFCVNDGRNVSDLDMRKSGYLTLTGLQWLPNHAGLVLSLSYGGEGSGPQFCAFNYSRIRTYQAD